MTELEDLERALGHRFLNRETLTRALTHSSRVHEQVAPCENGVPAIQDNEQMEFLGDAVLGFLISEALVSRFPGYPEGRLSKLKAHLVSAVHLHAVALRLDLGKYLFLGRGEEMSGGRSKKTLQVNGLEALIAALYLDAGIEVTRQFVTRCVVGEGTNTGLDERMLAGSMVDFKSALQELAQARKLPPPRYVIVKERGPEHSKTFTVEVRVGKELAAQAEGLSKKSAAQDAARTVLAKLSEQAAG